MSQVQPGPLDKSRGGRRTVIYRDAKGRTSAATVLAAGSSSGLKLLVTSKRSMGVSGSTIDNVALATGEKQTNVYFNRKTA